MDDISVREMMTKDVISCSPEEPLQDVVTLLASKKLSCIVIVEEGSPIGIVTERDLVEVLSEALQGITWNKMAIRNFMTSPVTTIDEELMLNDVILLAHMQRIRHIPVVDITGKLVGILTQSNIIEGCYQGAS